VVAVCTTLKVSERRACKVLGQVRATQRYRAVVRSDEAALKASIVELSLQYGRYGYRRITGLLRHEGWHVNAKRVERIWRREGLKVPRRHRPRRRLWLADGSCVRLRPERKDHVWAYDFVAARTHDGRPVRMLTIVDEYTRECLAIDVARKLSSEEVMARLTELFVFRGIPDHIRSDNGSEFTATAIRDWLARLGVKTLYIEPGSPWENGYCESFNGKLRDECLNSHVFASVAEAQVVLDAWREDYNAVRPHSALQDRTPAAVGAMWVNSREPRESTAIKKDGIELEITGLSVAFQS
jgi:putative transposase